MTISGKFEGSTVADTDRLVAAQSLLKRSRTQGLAELNALFRSGHPPQPPLDGSYAGQLVAVTIAPGISHIVQWLTAIWMPWAGKHLDAATQQGDNILKRGYRMLFRLLFPFYRGVVEHDEQAFRAFAFDTSIGSGLQDADRQVFKIDYDKPENPRWAIRPIVDEVVQIEPGVYLGKIHFKWWCIGWRMIGYFALRGPA